jgi:hypothetical protein
MDSTYHSILSMFGLANPYIIKSWAGGIFMIFYLLLILIVISALTASITSFLAARVEVQFKIFDNAPLTTAQTPFELGAAVEVAPKGSLVLQAGSTSEAYARQKMFINTEVDEEGNPVRVQHLGNIDPSLGELGQMDVMIKDSQYLAILTYTPSLDAFMAQEEAKARDFRQKNPSQLSNKAAKSEVCNEKWYLSGA